MPDNNENTTKNVENKPKPTQERVKNNEKAPSSKPKRTYDSNNRKPSSKSAPKPEQKPAVNNKPIAAGAVVNNRATANNTAKPPMVKSHKPVAKAATSTTNKPNSAKPVTNTEKPNSPSKAVGDKLINRRAPRTNTRPKVSSRNPLKIISLGGLGEIGKNITYYEYENEALLVDCGLAFPDDDMLGVDIVIPDFNYVMENRNKIKGLYITHGHEDHIGAVPYLLKKFNVQIHATKLTISLIEGKLKEHGLLKTAKLHTVVAGETIKQGKMSVEFINVNHSIPDACSLAIHTPAGVVIQTGDFKVDFTPIAGDVINLARFGELGSKGVLALLSDSTNAERPGNTASERTVGEAFDKLFQDAHGKRIIVATFASNVHRVQQIIDGAIRYDRKVAVTGRSMENLVERSLELGYLNMPKDVLIDIESAETLPSGDVVIVTTGSQGETMSALTRMARGDHRKITVTNYDYIIISATPIPGNEKHVSDVVNELLKTGARVIYERMYDVHVSGHACQDELKLMLALTKPKFFVPVHGEYKQMRRHADLGRSMGIADKNIYMGEIGDVITVDETGIRSTEKVTAGETLVDGLGVGDVGSIVLRDRKHLSEDGLIVVMATIERKTGKLLAGPDIVSRGFVYVRESEDLIAKARDIARKSIESAITNGTREWGVIKTKVRDEVSSYVWQTTKRSPMILPMIQEI